MERLAAGSQSWYGFGIASERSESTHTCSVTHTSKSRVDDNSFSVLDDGVAQRVYKYQRNTTHVWVLQRWLEGAMM